MISPRGGGGLYWENCPQIQSKTKQKTVNLLPTIRLAQSILKRKFPSVDKPLNLSLWKIQAPVLIFGILRYDFKVLAVFLAMFDWMTKSLSANTIRFSEPKSQEEIKANKKRELINTNKKVTKFALLLN